MELKIVDFNNYKLAIKIQHKIFPHEDGTLNILASLDRDLFIKLTKMDYPDDNVKYYIAFDKGKAIGITGLYYYQKEEVWLGWFGVLLEHRNRGYGKTLLEETIQLAKKIGHQTMRLYTDKEENCTAIKLYKKLGFIEEKYCAEKLSYDCWIYSKSLYNDEINLWNNKNLNLTYQSEMDQMNENKVNEILDMYEKLKI